MAKLKILPMLILVLLVPGDISLEKPVPVEIADRVLRKAPDFKFKENPELMKKEISRYVNQLLYEDKKFADNREFIKSFYEFLQAHSVINDNFVGDDTPALMVSRALRGMVNELDPYSHLYMDDEVKEFFASTTEEEETGLGFSLAPEGQNWLIVGIVPGSGIDNSGIAIGDVLAAVDGHPVTGLDVKEVVPLILGDGSKRWVTLGVAKEKTPGKIKNYRFKIDNHPYPSVAARNLSGILYVRIYKFLEKTPERFLGILKKSKAQRLILDLRDCPGGNDRDAQEVIAPLIGGGKLFAKLKFKDGKTEDLITKNSSHYVKKFSKIAVLVNKKTASASEMIIGNLQFYKHAKLIGETTFGKGIFQQFYDLDSAEHQLKESRLIVGFTSGRYYLPDGRMISAGIPPDIEVPAPKLPSYFFGALEKDIQLQAAIHFLESNYD